MFKCLLLSGWICPKAYLRFLIAVLLIAPVLFAPIQSTKADPVAATVVPRLPTEPALPSTTVPAALEGAMNEPPGQIDPLDSPHPIPWNWVMTTQADVSSKSGSGVRYYRSQSLVSPDGEYAAYSRIQLQVQPELYRSRVSSVMFVENLQTGELREIATTSPLAQDANMPGTISMVTPVGWSETGDRLLAREFAGLFNSSDASDSAVIWNRQQNRINTVAPSQSQYNYDFSVLLGWSQTHPDQVLFRASNLDDEQLSLWSVKSDGQTVAAADVDQPLIFGKLLNQIWDGPQVAYR